MSRAITNNISYQPQANQMIAHQLCNTDEHKHLCKMPFLKSDLTKDVHLDLADQEFYKHGVALVEKFLNNIVVQSTTTNILDKKSDSNDQKVKDPIDQTGLFKILMVNEIPQYRNFIFGNEEAYNMSLSQALNLVQSRIFNLDDIIFLRGKDELWLNPNDQDALYLAIHLLAMLTASKAETCIKDQVYLSACVTILASLNTDLLTHDILLDDFQRMWLRNIISSKGDPIAWDFDALDKVKLLDKDAAKFMQGLSFAMKQFEPFAIPTTVEIIYNAACFVQKTSVKNADSLVDNSDDLDLDEDSSDDQEDDFND